MYPTGEKGQVKGVDTHLLPGGIKDVIDKALVMVTSDALPTFESSDCSSTNISLQLAKQSTIQIPSAAMAQETTHGGPTTSKDAAHGDDPAHAANTKNSVQPENETVPHFDETAHQANNSLTYTAHGDGDDPAHTGITNNSVQPGNRMVPRIKETAHPANNSLAYTAHGDDTAQPANNSLTNNGLQHEDETAHRTDAQIPQPFPTPPITETDASRFGVTGSGDNDVDMDDEGSRGSSEEFRNEDLPPWLVPMMGYLRGLSEDVAWQNLVTTFIAFERQHPPNGVSRSICSLFLVADYMYI